VDTIPFAIAIERKPPEFNLLTSPPSAVEPKPRAEPLDVAPKPMPRLISSTRHKSAFAGLFSPWWRPWSPFFSEMSSKIKLPLFVDPSESKQTDRPGIDEPMPVTERPPLELSGRRARGNMNCAQPN
jgi:hypothetical protein